MKPAFAIAQLDKQLAQHGQDILLRRAVAAVPTDVTCRAKVSDYTIQELTPGSGLLQGDSKVIISPTQIVAAGWPGVAANKVVGDERIPKAQDIVVISGRQRKVKGVVPVYMGGELVRINMTVAG